MKRHDVYHSIMQNPPRNNLLYGISDVTFFYPQSERKVGNMAEVVSRKMLIDLDKWKLSLIIIPDKPININQSSINIIVVITFNNR